MRFHLYSLLSCAMGTFEWVAGWLGRKLLWPIQWVKDWAWRRAGLAKVRGRNFDPVDFHL